MENLDNWGYIDRTLYLECRRGTRLCFLPSFFAIITRSGSSSSQISVPLHSSVLYSGLRVVFQGSSVCVNVFKDCKCALSDYLGTIRFGVVTDKRVAEEISLVHSGSVYLHRHANTSLVSIAVCCKDSDVIQGCSRIRITRLLEWVYWQRFCGRIVGTVKTSVLV